LQHFGRFFHQIKVRQPVGRNDSIQTVCQRSKRLEEFLYEAAQNFKRLFKYSRSKLKNQKPIAGDVLVAGPSQWHHSLADLAGWYF
jgi:hypothetical protein